MQNQRKRVELSESVGPTKRFVFVLLERFSMLSFASAVECLRIANRVAGSTLYTWSLTGDGGETKTCSAGVTFTLDDDLGDPPRDATILVCGGIDVAEAFASFEPHVLELDTGEFTDQFDIETFDILRAESFVSAFGEVFKSDPEAFGADIAANVALGLTMSLEDRAWAHAEQTRILRRFNAVMQEVDVILLPTAPVID